MTKTVQPDDTIRSIPTLPAGRELDAIVAERVMGWRVFPYQMLEVLRNGGPLTLCPPDLPVHVSNVLPVPSYSTDIAAAWAVAEKITNAYGLKIVVLPGAAEVHWVCTPPAASRWREVTGSGETLPLAICRCALLSVVQSR